MKNPLIFLLLILGMVGYVITETCPPSEDISPCACVEDEEDDDEIVVFCEDSGTTLDQIKGVLKTLAGKKNVHFELHDINLGTLPGNLFKDVNIKRLDINHCDVESFTDSDDIPPFSGLEDSLVILNIISSIDEENYGPTNIRVDHLRRLKELEFTGNVIKVLKNECCEKVPPALEIYVVSNNMIESLGDRAFRNLNNLKRLSLDGNRFGPIVRSMLPSSPDKLEELELDNNAFESLPKDLFSNMPSLRRISLNNNGIVRLDKDTWEPIWDQVDVIYLNGNPVECDSHMSWMFDLRKTAAIYGTCKFPSDKHGMSLQDFIDNRGQ